MVEANQVGLTIFRTFLNQIAGVSKPSAKAGRKRRESSEFRISGSRERELGVDVRFHASLAVRASGTAGLGTSAEGLINDGLDGARAAAAFGAAAEAAVNLLGIARKMFRGADSAADIVVAKDVAGTDNHTNGHAHR